MADRLTKTLRSYPLVEAPAELGQCDVAEPPSATTWQFSLFPNRTRCDPAYIGKLRSAMVYTPGPIAEQMHGVLAKTGEVHPAFSALNSAMYLLEGRYEEAMGASLALAPFLAYMRRTSHIVHSADGVPAGAAKDLRAVHGEAPPNVTGSQPVETWGGDKVSRREFAEARERAWMVQQELAAKGLKVSETVSEDGKSITAVLLAKESPDQPLCTMVFEVAIFKNLSAMERASRHDLDLRAAALLGKHEAGRSRHWNTPPRGAEPQRAPEDPSAAPGIGARVTDPALLKGIEFFARPEVAAFLNRVDQPFRTHQLREILDNFAERHEPISTSTIRVNFRGRTGIFENYLVLRVQTYLEKPIQYFIHRDRVDALQTAITQLSQRITTWHGAG